VLVFLGVCVSDGVEFQWVEIVILGYAYHNGDVVIGEVSLLALYLDCGCSFHSEASWSEVGLFVVVGV
tara:strand:+ start:380 stop:583 length:204 start_codon:yes stop_codon:yes gene_type:complete